MILELIGVLRDASKPAGTVKQLVPEEQNIDWPRYEDGTIQLTVKRQNLNLANLTGAQSVIMAVRRSPEDVTPVFSRTGTVVDAVNGRVDFAIAQADTSLATDDTEYYYDIVYTDSGGKRWQLIPGSIFRVVPEYAKPADVSNIPLATVKQIPMASHDPTLVANFLLDYDGGNDANEGVVYAAPGAQIVPTGKAIKTLARLKEIFPLYGAGRIANILIKTRVAGAVYRNVANTADDDIDLVSDAYDYIGIFGSTDLTRSPTDFWTMGARIAHAGPNGDQSWTVGAGATTTSIPVDAAQTLPAANTFNAYRIRFITGALASTSVGVRTALTNAAGAGAAVSLMDALGSAPAQGDKFVVEEPGAAVRDLNIRVSSVRSQSVNGAKFPVVAIAGVRVTGTTNGAMFRIQGSGAGVQLAFVHQTASGVFCSPGNGIDSLDVRTAVNLDTGASASSANVGGCLFRSVTLVNYMRRFTTTGAGYLGTFTTNPSLTITSCDEVSVGVGDYLNGVFDTGVPSSARAFSGSFLGTHQFGVTAGPIPTIRAAVSTSGGMVLQGVPAVIRQFSITGCGANPAIGVQNGGGFVVIDGVTGSTGNTGVGIDLSTSRGTRVLIQNTTVTGTAGDIKLGGNAIARYADLAVTNVVDTRGNVVLAAVDEVIAQPAILVTNKDGTQVMVGEIVRGNGTSGQVVRARADNPTNAGGPLLVMLTSPANDAVGYAVPIGDGAWVLFDAAPAADALAYLDEGTAGLATTTVPPVAGGASGNQKRRLGFARIVSGNYARVVGSVENLSILSDGSPP